jgi:lysophospholipid acyltransferase (LPLAT)-like uncharacterized protein
MASWLEGLDILPIPISSQGERAGLWNMATALDGGHDALLALDGPMGPRRRAKSGILWVIAHVNYEMRAAGFWASPAFRLPRWDRQIVPLPGAKVTAAWAPVHRAQLLSDRRAAALERLNRQLDEMSELAIGSHKRNVLLNY